MPAKKKAVSPRAKQEPLSEGDHFEYGLTTSFKVDGADIWIKASASSTIRRGETADAAVFRVVEFVEDVVNARSEEWVGE